jgi:hypothetical protein
MSRYLVAIYRNELSEDHRSQIASILSDPIIEEINERMSLFLGSGYQKRYEFDRDYYCYRFLCDQMVPAFFFVEPRPLYIGLFNETEENKCAIMSAHCHGIIDLIQMNIGKGLELEPYFKGIFDQDSKMNMDVIHACVKELKKHFRLAKSIKKIFF